MTESDNLLNNITEPDDDGTRDQTNIEESNAALIEDFLRERDVPLVDDSLPPDHRSGYVAVVGKPNVGKSTLMNALLGEKLAIVSSKPQTTRSNQLGILTHQDFQIVFVDTPGIHKARTKLGEYMVDVAQSSIPDADVVLFIVDLSESPDAADEAIANLIRDTKPESVILTLNKRALVDEDVAADHFAAYQDLVSESDPLEISATEGLNVDRLLDKLVERLPAGPRYFPADILTQTQLRDNVAEVIREQALHLYEQEVPHALAVKVEEFKERSANLTYIAATIYVERDSQKAILIGKKGEALKQLGKLARAELEPMLGTRVYLELWVKVLKNWRKDETALKRLGFDSSK